MFSDHWFQQLSFCRTSFYFSSVQQLDAFSIEFQKNRQKWCNKLLELLIVWHYWSNAGIIAKGSFLFREAWQWSQYVFGIGYLHKHPGCHSQHYYYQSYHPKLSWEIQQDFRVYNKKMSKQNSNKPFTGAFELQTKIRVIIQDVLAATVRKLSQFNEKVQSFEDFFFTFKQRISDLEEKSKLHGEYITKNRQTITKNKGDVDTELVRLQEQQQKAKIENNQIKQELVEVLRKITTINRQNQTITNDLSKTKSKFLEFGDQMNALKDDVSWKISKYIEETAETNTQIKISNEEMKKEYFNVNLALEINKAKYNEIITLKDQDENQKQKIHEKIVQLSTSLDEKATSLKSLNHKLDQMDTALYGKIKITQSKLDRRIEELVQNNIKIMQSVTKVDDFASILDEIREQSEKTSRKLLKKFEDSDQKHKEVLNEKLLEVNKNLLQNEKMTEKKIKGITESQQKFVDFFNQKIQYLKIEIETELSTKATTMLEEKSKSQNGITNSAIDALTERVNKINLQTTKNINGLQNTVKQVKRQVEHQVSQIKQTVETKIEKTISTIEASSGAGVSPQFMRTLNERFEKVIDDVELKIFEMNKDLTEQNVKIIGVERLKEQTIESLEKLTKQNKDMIQSMETKLTGKVQKVMFLVTKMRGDGIIRNQFTDKQIRQLRKNYEDTTDNLGTVFKVIPAVGEALNLIMCLIFDAQQLHSKIIQDSLPAITKESQKFQTIIEGILYEFKEKRKPGTIHYRHKEYRKTDLVKATLNAYTRTWEELFENLGEMENIIPKNFYKLNIEKFIGTKQSISHISRIGSTKKVREIMSHDYLKSKHVNKVDYSGGQSLQKVKPAHDTTEVNDQPNRSFQIRKKKTAGSKPKDENMMMRDEENEEND